MDINNSMPTLLNGGAGASSDPKITFGKQKLVITGESSKTANGQGILCVSAGGPEEVRGMTSVFKSDKAGEFITVWHQQRYYDDTMGVIRHASKHLLPILVSNAYEFQKGPRGDVKVFEVRGPLSEGQMKSILNQIRKWINIWFGSLSYKVDTDLGRYLIHDAFTQDPPMPPGIVKMWKEREARAKSAGQGVGANTGLPLIGVGNGGLA